MNGEPDRNEPADTGGNEASPPTDVRQQAPAHYSAQPAPPVPPAPAVGQPVARVDDPRRKSVVLAVVLSAMPGLGQVYVGYYPRGFTHALVVAGLIAFLTSMNNFTPLIPLAAIFLAFFWLYNMIDAGRRAAMYNDALAGGEAVDLPKDISMPGLRGSIVGGLVMIGIGAIILSHTAYDVPLDWLDDWWPAGAVLFGVYLVAKGMMERSASTAQ
jgi:TM2 domain-containing membrane protein YozV